MIMITDEKAEEWAKRIIYFDWNGDKGSYSKYLKHFHGQERMYQDTVSENLNEEDILKIKSFIEAIVSDTWQNPNDEIVEYFKTRMSSIYKMGIYKYGTAHS